MRPHRSLPGPLSQLFLEPEVLAGVTGEGLEGILGLSGVSGPQLAWDYGQNGGAWVCSSDTCWGGWRYSGL